MMQAIAPIESHQIKPEVAQCVRELPGKTTNESNANRQPGCSGQKVLRAKSHHLAEIAHGALAGVALPRSGR